MKNMGLYFTKKKGKWDAFKGLVMIRLVFGNNHSGYKVKKVEEWMLEYQLGIYFGAQEKVRW